MACKASGKPAHDSTATSGFEGNIGKECADAFRSDLYPDPTERDPDYGLANLTFNDSDSRDEAETAAGNWSKGDDVRWQFGVPPKRNANFAWVQHFIHHLAPHGAFRMITPATCRLK